MSLHQAAWLVSCLVLWCLPWRIPASTADPEWYYEPLPPDGASSTRLHTEHDNFTMYANLWWHNKRFYGVLDESEAATVLKPAMSYNTGLMGLPVRDARQFSGNVKAGWVPGVALLLDLAFPAYPDNMGHWSEALVPLYNVLEGGAWRLPGKAGPGQANASAAFISTLVFVNLRREQLSGLDWVWQMLRVTLARAVAPRRDLPRIIYYNYLDHLDKAAWLGFEYALVVRDRYAAGDGRAGFASPALAGRFREAAFAMHKLRPPDAKSGAPRTITLLTAVAGEEVVNRDELSAALRDVGATLGLKFRPYTATARAPFESYLSVMARTGVLVARHGPLLANAMFLPPGAVVMELLPYNWEWQGISRLYANLTASRGDIHHMAWRAQHPRWAVYGSPDEAKYADWSAEECRSSQCLAVHARAGMRVDTAAVQEMLWQVLPGALEGASVESLRRPWPELLKADGGTGLWWDK